ncbi:hypothetical protein GCM10007898_07320 [Dyella flagellata]|uniref:Lipoprotein n=2 Tax=Dyella flagellata TaxID=1867833 RepID=A0ABQ5X7L3_9GAMM|nr:hypothetical protein GCM10007898_07320 [Dyella flagellata]
MQTRIVHFRVFTVLTLMAASSACAGQFGDARPVSLANGFNHVVLGGHDATIVVADRENYNAHDFTVATIYMQGPSDLSNGQVLNLVPVFYADAKDQYERLHLVKSGGADCVLHDFRILASARSDAAWLIRAERDMQRSFADAEPVHFYFYRLKENKEEQVGRPPVYFEFDHRVDATKPYCDVDEAMSKELGISSQ